MAHSNSSDEHGDQPAARTSEESKRPHSIDLTLELERQLDNESLPPSSPAPPRRPQSRPQSLDPHVLASIVTQLRLNLEEVTKERDGLAHLYAEAQASQSEMKTILDTVSEKCVRLENDLVVSIEKQKEDADAVTMLRSKLEDSRRALMRLQTESRRASNLTIDPVRAGQPTNKRASFAPLTGSPAARGQSHRRIASVSDSGFASSPPDFMSGPSSPTPSSRRMSSIFGRGPLPLDLPAAAESSEMEELRKELHAVKEQLEETRHELTEAQEAREASETCVNALRTFISDHSIGLGPARSSNAVAKSPEDGNAGASKWSFKLWKSESASSSTAPAPTVSAPPLTSASTTASSSRFGGFFSSRASVSSTGSSGRLDSNPRPHSGQQEQEPMYNGSDSSSIEDMATEPISPASEAPRLKVLVREEEDLGEHMTYRTMSHTGGKGFEVPTSMSDDYMPIVR